MRCSTKILHLLLPALALSAPALGGCDPGCTNGFSPATPAVFAGADVVSITGEPSSEIPSVCATNDAGEVGCVGGFGDTAFAAPAADPAACSLDGEQNLTCDGSLVAPGVASFALAAQGLAVCFDRTDGTSACAWSDQAWADDEEEASLSATACVLLGTQVRCFQSPASMQSITSLAAGWTITETSADAGQSIPGLGPVAQLSLSSVSNVGCAIDLDGGVLCFGGSAQLGLGGAAAGSAAPVLDGSSQPLTDIVQLSVANDHACAVSSGGSVRCWGAGADSDASSQTAVEISGIGDAVSVAVGDSSGSDYGSVNCALERGGKVVCWGSDFATECQNPFSFYPGPGD